MKRRIELFTGGQNVAKRGFRCRTIAASDANSREIDDVGLHARVRVTRRRTR